MVSRWLLAWLLAAMVCVLAPSAHAVVDVAHPVTDPNEYLTRAQRDALSDVLQAHRGSTQVQIAVLFVANTEGRPIEDYAHEVAVRWGGGERGQNRGALVLFAVGDRRSRIEVGYGLESELTDGVTRQLLDEARPFLRSSNYAAAAASVVDGLFVRTGGSALAMAAVQRAGSAVTSYADTQHYHAPQDNSALVFLFICFLLFSVVALLVWAMMRSDNSNYSVSSGGSSYYPTGGGGGPSYSSTSVNVFYSSTPSYSSGSSSYDSGSSSSSYDSSSSYSSSSYDSSSSSSYDSGSSSSSYDSSSSYSSSDSSYSGGGGDFGGGGSSSDW